MKKIMEGSKDGRGGREREKEREKEREREGKRERERQAISQRDNGVSSVIGIPSQNNLPYKECCIWLHVQTLPIRKKW